jgi:hypothetical protein
MSLREDVLRAGEAFADPGTRLLYVLARNRGHVRLEGEGDPPGCLALSATLGDGAVRLGWQRFISGEEWCLFPAVLERLWQELVDTLEKQP